MATTTKRRTAAPKEYSTFPAFDLSREQVKLYMTAVRPSEIFPFTRVSRVEENPETGFQRALDTHRVRKISEYIREGKVVPGAIIISAQDDARITFDPKSGLLKFPSEEGFFLVIDGQHRLYGSVRAEAELGIDVKIPVCILANLSSIDEVQYFIDINGNQKGVSKTLRIELTKFLVEEESIDGIRLRLFEDMNSDPKSPLFGHLSATKRNVGLISHVPFKAALDKILAQNPLKKLTYDKKEKLLNNFLGGVKANLDEIDQGRKLYQSAFFQAIFRVFEKSCEIALMYHRNYSEETFESIFVFIQDIDYDAHSGSNDEAMANLAKEIAQRLEISLITATVSEDLL
jgi:DGQHR domain-containing protein